MYHRTKLFPHRQGTALTCSWTGIRIFHQAGNRSKTSFGYFKNLAREDVLDPDYANTAGVDVDAQKAAWEAVGTDTSGWDDATAKKRTFKSAMFLAADVKMLDAIEDLKFVVNMA